jgi:D-alanyl-D-alanine carboxypeptidase/D-alanyl-D-alanine-endopeptidase (penicillin-binding protein 4)
MPYRWCRLSAIAIFCLPWFIPSAAKASEPKICPSQLQSEITKITDVPALQTARVGVFVQASPSQEVLANLDGDRYFIPASSTKLFTTAIALKKLGTDYRFATRLMSPTAPTTDGTLENGLWLAVSGDPSFQSATGLKSLVTQLKDRGVKRINGGIWGITSMQGPELVGSWEWQDLQEYYAAIASPFTIDGNSLYWSIQPTKIGEPVKFNWDIADPSLANDWKIDNQSKTVAAEGEYDLTVTRVGDQKILRITGQMPIDAELRLGGVAMPNPKDNFLRLLRRELVAQGIQISPVNNVQSTKPPVLAQELAIAVSPPLSAIVNTTNKDSDNLYAELLLRALGDRSMQAKTTSNDNLVNGLATVNQYLQTVKVANVSLADGSGLSRRNLATPRAISQLLQTSARDQAFRKSLPIAGLDGTLTNRFKDTAAQTILQAKTGTLTGAISLSGYVQPPNYNEVTFSIMINNSNLPSTDLRQYTDTIAVLLTRLAPCP